MSNLVQKGQQGFSPVGSVNISGCHPVGQRCLLVEQIRSEPSVIQAIAEKDNDVVYRTLAKQESEYAYQDSRHR